MLTAVVHWFADVMSVTSIRPLTASALLAPICVLQAQGGVAVRHGSIAGIVYDSVHGAPLMAARVEISTRALPGRQYATVSDSAGQFRITDLPPDAYLIGFYHDMLLQLGLEMPVRGVTVTSDSLLWTELSIPSARVVRSLRCPDSPSDSLTGMMGGFIRDAVLLRAMPHASLRFSWRVLALEAGNYRSTIDHISAQIESDGTFLACGIPTNAPLDIEALAPGYRSLIGPVAPIAENGVSVLDVRLVDTLSIHGGGTITGRVRYDAGRPVTSGESQIFALNREQPIRDGHFVLTDIPAGSWFLSLRAMGAEPATHLVSVPDGVTTLPTIVLREPGQSLDTVRVLGTKRRDMSVLDDVLRRRQLGLGTVFLADSPALQTAVMTSDVMRDARGFQYLGPSNILGRATSRGQRCRTIAVYVDGNLQPNSFEGLNARVAPSDVLAIEAFADVRLAPVQFRTMKFASDADTPSGRPELYCAVVLVWTRAGR